MPQQKKCIIIAEAGVNHNGDINMAKQLVDAAANAGADYVKFQTFVATNAVTANAKKAQYQITNTGNNSSQLDMIKKLELNHEQHFELIKYCKLKKIKFLSTAFDLESVAFLKSLKLDLIKIPSGEITNLRLLEACGGQNKNILLSTGMCNLAEINDAIKVIVKSGTSKNKITLLHCTTEYPAPFKDINLNAMKTMQQKFKLPVGYSDHTEGIAISLAAVAMGATVIEKHITIDRTLPGPDHRASIEPDEFAQLVKGIREIELSMGDGEKKAMPSEKKNIAIARKSICAKTDIKKGTLLNDSLLTAKRPGTGISPMLINNLIGKKIKKDLPKDTLLKWSDLK